MEEFLVGEGNFSLRGSLISPALFKKDQKLNKQEL